MMAKVMHFFGNTKLFCHFLLADIEKVLIIYAIFNCFSLIFSNIFAIKNNTGNSINGPIINANEISGLSGNVATAIASAIGEFLASVVKFSATLS